MELEARKWSDMCVCVYLGDEKMKSATLKAYEMHRREAYEKQTQSKVRAYEKQTKGRLEAY